MILAVDIGNTGITFGFYEEEALKSEFRISSAPIRTGDEYAILLRLWCEQKKIKSQTEGCVISCVVPPLKRPIETAVEDVFGCRPLFVGHGVKTGLNIRVDHQTDVGSDIVANMVGVCGRYPGPAAVVDFGTATTLAAVNAAGEMTGVAIMPGVQVGLAALASSTAALPEVSLGRPGGILGKNTEASMISGCIYGAASMVDGMISRLREEMMSDSLRVFACGSLADRIVPYCRTPIEIWPHLTLDGLIRIYYLNVRRKSL